MKAAIVASKMHGGVAEALRQTFQQTNISYVQIESIFIEA